MFRKYPILTILVTGYYILFAATISSMVWGRVESPMPGPTCGTGYLAIYMLQLMVMFVLVGAVLAALIKAPHTHSSHRRFLWLLLAALVLPNVVLVVIVMWGG